MKVKYASLLQAGLFILGGALHAAMAAEPDPGGGIGGTGITGVGPVQRFGSIFVNGREFFIDEHTDISADGVSLSERDLRLGDVVVVQGRVDTASGRSQAVRIAVERALQGLVEKVDVEAGTFTVLGQVVRVTPHTFGQTPGQTPWRLSQVRVDEPVTVSGIVREDGSWTATRVSRPVSPAAGAVSFVLHGTLRAVDQTHGTLTIGTQTLRIASTHLPPNLVVGQSVRVTGRYLTGVPAIQDVRIERRDLGNAGSRVELAGYIQASSAPGRAVCNNTLLHYGADTQFTGGTTAQLTRGMPVVIQGTLRADGSITAERILLRVEFLRAELPSVSIQSHEKAVQPPEHRPSQPERPSIERPWIDRPGRPGL